MRSRTRGIHAPIPHFLLWTSSNDKPRCLENSRRAAAELCRYEKSPALHFRLNQDMMIAVRMVGVSNVLAATAMLQIVPKEQEECS